MRRIIMASIIVACDGEVYRAKVVRLPYDPDIIHLVPASLTDKQR